MLSLLNMSEGLNEILFHLLWTKDKVFDQIVKAMIPDTVIYQYALPRFWYFTSKTGVIMKKSNQNLNDQTILETFTKKVSGSGIVAMLLYIEEGKHIVDYLNLTRFENFIKTRKKNNDLILQKFIDPYGDYNFCYTVIWTSNLCLFEKKENRQKLYNNFEADSSQSFGKTEMISKFKSISADKNMKTNRFPRNFSKPNKVFNDSSLISPLYHNESSSLMSKLYIKTKENNYSSSPSKAKTHEVDLYERAVTFDGKEFHINTTPVRGAFLPNQLIKTADSIVSHVAAVSFEKMRITRMVLQMKLDKKKRLWVLCSTCLRFSNDHIPTDIQLNVDFHTTSDLNIQNLTTDKRNPAKFSKDCKCALCLSSFESNKVVKFSYSEIFEMYGANPIPIYNTHPRIQKDDIKKLKEKPEFLLKKLFLCFECYLNFVETHKRPLVTSLPNISYKHNLTKTRTEKSLSISKISQNEQLLTNSSVFNLHSLASPSTPGLHSTKINTFSTRTTKTAGGEVIIGFPSLKD